MNHEFWDGERVEAENRIEEDRQEELENCQD